MNDGLPLPAPYSNIYPHHKDDGCHYVCYSPSTQPGEGRPNHQPVYTADQMREYAKRAVDAERGACAQAGKGALKLHASLGVVVEKAIRARGNT